MEPRLQQTILEEARNRGLRVAPDFYQHLDTYVSKHFRQRSIQDQNTIQAYLAHAGLQIALKEGKSVAQADDAKAAVWLFHLPSDPDDTCEAAGEYALEQEQSREPYQRGLLSEGFRRFLRR